MTHSTAFCLYTDMYIRYTHNYARHSAYTVCYRTSVCLHMGSRLAPRSMTLDDLEL